jgi:hypothetical protein
VLTKKWTLSTGRLIGKSLLVVDEVLGRQLIDQIELAGPEHLVVEAPDQSVPSAIATF